MNNSTPDIELTWLDTGERERKSVVVWIHFYKELLKTNFEITATHNKYWIKFLYL